MKIKNDHTMTTSFFPDLSLMQEEFARSPVIYHPSPFWEQLVRRHMSELQSDGGASFKQTVNRKYFNFGLLGLLRTHYPLIFRGIKQRHLAPFFSSSAGVSPWGYGYGLLVSLLYEYVKEIDASHLLDKYTEPPLGHPFSVWYLGKRISQDLCHSVAEWYAIAPFLPKKKKLRCIELGAGYGRTAYVFLSELPRSSSYCIVDIPPALAVSQSYLSCVFPTEKIFHFRPFRSFAEVKNEFENSRIQFLLPHQVALLPTDFFDCSINISTFHEMTVPQIHHYFHLLDRVTGGIIYLKLWKTSRVKDNAYIRQDQYPIPRAWQRIYHKPDTTNTLFFESVYKQKKNK
jgi:putative sugar O-methyltransferase